MNAARDRAPSIIESAPPDWRGRLVGLVALFGMFTSAPGAAAAPRGSQVVDRAHQAVGRDYQPTDGAIPCLESPDCDDGDGCTADSCIDGLCMVAPILGCVPCEIETTCPPVDVVFVMDTSGSMMDEAEALCEAMDNIVADLAADGIVVHPTILGITETPGGAFSCLSNDVVALLGGEVPGDGASCPFPDSFSAYESWGPASAIVAQRFAWNEGSIHVVVPMSDEGPCNGSLPDGCNDPGDDRDAIMNAVSIATLHNVVISPVTGTGSDVCVTTLANDVAFMTGGVALATSNPHVDLADAFRSLVEVACETRDACDDNDVCTVNDTCSENGVCSGTPVESIACASDVDCFGSPCDRATGFCECPDQPELCIDLVTPLPEGLTCHDEDTVLEFRVRLGFSAHLIIGGQFLIRYDPTALDFLSVEPGRVSDPTSPFSEPIFQDIDESTGDVFYAVGATLEHFGSHGPTTMATLRFRPKTACVSDELCFFDDNPMNTTLSDSTGRSVPYIPCCSGDIVVGGGPPTLICPRSVQLNADAGQLFASAEWGPVVATSGCGGPVELVCTAEHSQGYPVDGLMVGGGRFPIGTAQFACTVTDSECGGTASCNWNVTVNEASLVEIDVQLSAEMAPGPLDRCIEFTFYPSCAEAPVEYTATVRFGGAFNFPGVARRVRFKIPAGEYDCVTARDPLHTLRSVADVQIEGTAFAAEFLGDPVFGGNWLIGGNLNGDHVIDVLDLAILISQMGNFPDADTPCGTTGRHADINGDGTVDMLDSTFIERNLGAQDKEGCCPDGRSGPTTMEISVKELRSRGWGELSIADLNLDGVVNAEDLTALQQGAMSPKSRAGRSQPKR